MDRDAVPVDAGWTSQPNILLHINLRDTANVLQQEAVGILGVNLVYAAFHELATQEEFFTGLVQDLPRERIEIDFVQVRGPAFPAWNRHTVLAYLVHAGLAEAVLFSPSGVDVPPTEILHKRAIVLAPGDFGHVDAAHRQIHVELLAAGVLELSREIAETNQTSLGIFALTAASTGVNTPAPEIPDLLRRIDALLARGSNVLLFRQPELYTMTAFANRYTDAPVRYVIGLSLLIRAFSDPYFHLEGRRLEGLSRLFAQNVRIYAFPMTASDLREAIKELPTTGLQWDDTNGWVTADKLRVPPPVGHLYAYLLASNFLVSLQRPLLEDSASTR